MHKSWIDLIPYYVAGTLPYPQVADLERHLAVCEDCRIAVQEWQTVAGVVRSEARQWAAQSPMLPPPDLIAAFSANGRSQAAPPTVQIPAVRTMRESRSASLTMAAAMIAVLLIGGMMLLYLASRPDQSEHGAAATKTGTATKAALQGYTATPYPLWTITMTPFGGGAGSQTPTPFVLRGTPSPTGLRDTRTPSPSYIATPTAVYNWHIGTGSYSLVTLEDVQGIPAGTAVRVEYAWFDGDAWVYAIVPNNGETMAYARDWQLRAASSYATPYVTPTARYQDSNGMGGYALITLEDINGIPAGTRVRISSMWLNGSVWMYTIVTLGDEVVADVRENQITYVPGVTPGPTATSPFEFAYGYAMITLEQVGDIPANTLVSLGSGWYDRIDGWYYGISTRNGLTATANEHQLAYAPGVTPGPVPTPLFSNYAGGYPLITLEQIGQIPANTRVRISHSWYDSLKGWIHMIVMQDEETTAEARENQIAYAPGYVPGPTPTARYFNSTSSSSYSLTLIENVGSIQAGEPVRIGSGYYAAFDGWIYTVVAQDEMRTAEVNERLLIPLGNLTPTPVPCQYTTTLTRDCPQTQTQIQVAYLAFENGFMLWRSDTRQIYALYADNNTYDSFVDTWTEGETLSDDGQTPPSGTYRPTRGFGKVWAAQTAVRSRLGWAISSTETGYITLLEGYNGNVALTLPDGRVMLLEQAPPIWAIVP